MQQSVNLTPTIIHPYPQIDQSFVPVTYCSRRFRKILPKLDTNVLAHNTSDILPSVGNTIVHNVPQNPYIIIIPRVDNTINQIPNNVRLPRVSKRKPILRITVNKMCNTEEEMRSCNGLNMEDSSDDEDHPEQVEIKNYKLNRSVIFSLDPITGEILVTKRAIRDSTCPEEIHGDDDKIDCQQDIGSPEATEELGNSCADAGNQ